MRIILLHSDFIEYEPLTKALKNAEEIADKEGKHRIEECLVVLSAVEKSDEGKDPSGRVAEQISKVAENVKTKKIVIYPWVHLSPDPSSPNEALRILKNIEQRLKQDNEFKDKGYEVYRAPFGWYKSFDIKVKGHPLSELSREIYSGEELPKEDEVVSEALKREEKVKSRFYILTQDGNLIEAEKFDYSKYPNLKKFMAYETKKIRAYAKEPPHIRLMKEHGIADYEPGSDVGNMRWYPKGRLIKSLLEDKITEMCIDYGAMEVETPIMYDFNHPALAKYLHRFPARQYVVKSEGKDFFLRFSACFGQFLMSHDFVISYKNLPLRMFELTKYSFRREQSGEVTGLKRLRAFTMPDMHTLCADIESSKREFYSQFMKSMEWMNGLGLDYETAFRIEINFYNENKEWFADFAKILDRPILIEMFDERYAYFITKFEFNFVDSMGKASALSTVQIDVENAERYDLSYVASDGNKKRPFVLHASLSGGIDRNIYALLEKEAINMTKGKKPMFPLWLAPTQVRIIPVSNAQGQLLDYCEELLKFLRNRNIRADFDDRDETMQKKIREAEKEWVPYVIVIGQKEVEKDLLSLRIREPDGTNVQELKKDELVNHIKDRTKGMPFKKLSLPDHLSKRAII